MKKYNATATFFITGNNNGKGEIDNEAYPWAGYIQRMHAEGHQIASHTWSHLDLGSAAPSQGQEVLTRQQRLDQMYYNEMAFRNILGFFPTYMRPPYSDCDAASGCEADMAALGYNVVYFDLDTEDYLMDAPTLIQTSKNVFLSSVSNCTASESNWLSISHDIHYETAYNLTEYMLQTLLAQGFKPVTVGECLGDPKSNWYRNAPGGGVFTQYPAASPTVMPPIAAPTSVSRDGTCGQSSGLTCQGSTFGSCCSASNYCGSSPSYCGIGCQSGFGTCGSSSTSTASPPSTTTNPALKASVDGTCGGPKGETCQGSPFGNCCSKSGWCGSTDGYCGNGCQAGFGACGSGSTTPPPTKPPMKISTNGSCGGSTGFICEGSSFGNCCSATGWW